MTDEDLQTKIDFIEQFQRKILALKTEAKNSGYPVELFLSDFQTSLSLSDKCLRAFKGEKSRRDEAAALRETIQRAAEAAKQHLDAKANTSTQ